MNKPIEDIIGILERMGLDLIKINDGTIEVKEYDSLEVDCKYSKNGNCEECILIEDEKCPYEAAGGLND